MGKYQVSDTMVRRCVKLLQEPHVCTVCGKELVLFNELARHIKKVH